MTVLLFVVMVVLTFGVAALALGAASAVSLVIYDRFARTHAHELIADWELQLELLDGGGQNSARDNPPTNIAEALMLTGAAGH